jgi:phospholipid/cholesterol/gamma-HCH transport system ATP-binding protein
MPAVQENSKLRIEGLAVGYGEHPVQRDLSFDVRSGSIFAIMGASGCGKSTVLKALVGLLRPSAGAVFFGSENYWCQPEARRAAIGRRFGVSFQEGALWSSMTASQNVALPLEMFTDLHATAIDALVQMKLSLVGLNAGRASMPADLSGGMRKRVGLARALSLDPEILFLDEPSAGLDPISSKGVDDLILSLRDGFGITVVMVSHELPSLLAICDDGVFLDSEAKTAIAHGAPRTLLETCKHPTVVAFMNRADAVGSDRKEED